MGLFSSHFCFLVFVILLSIVLWLLLSLILLFNSSGVFHTSVSRWSFTGFWETAILLGSLADQINAVIWRASVRPLIFNSSLRLTMLLGIVRSAPFTVSFICEWLLTDKWILKEKFNGTINIADYDLKFMNGFNFGIK